MTMVTLSEVEFEFDFDPYVVANQLYGGVPPVEEMEACRSLCDAIGREFADAAFQLLSSGTLVSAFSAFERQVMTASQACVRAVLKAGIESLDDGARHVFRGGRRHRRVQATPRRVMTSAGPVEYSRPRYRSESGAAILPVDEQVCFADGYFTERAAEQGVFLMSALSPRDCVSLYGKFGIEGASVSSLQRLAVDAGRLWSGLPIDHLATRQRRLSGLVPLHARRRTPQRFRFRRAVRQRFRACGCGLLRVLTLRRSERDRDAARLPRRSLRSARWSARR